MEIYPAGTIVCANYKQFKGEVKPGVFVILYDEALDSAHSHKNNVMALKCTTHEDMVSNYSMSPNDGNHDFMSKETVVACSKIHTLGKNQIFKTLGVVHPTTYKLLYKTCKKFMKELERQVEDYL